MRVLNSLRNSSMALVQTLVSILFGFLVRTVFIHTLGNNYNGLNGLFSSILSMLSIAELGIGSAIVFNMYRFIASKDTETMKSLMAFYRNCYRAVAGVVAFLGLILLPFLRFFSNYQGIHENIFIIYLLFLANSVAGYLFSYKRSILYADQKNYVISLFDLLTNLVTNVVYLIILLATQNFILYLLATLIISVSENLLINHVANQQYPWLKDKNVQKLQPAIFKKLGKQIYGMLYHNIGGYIVMGTDNLIISKFLGLATVGFYANYILITNSLYGLLSTVLGSLTASVGDLLTEDDPEKSFAVYKNISFITFWIYCFAGSAVFLVMQPFISIWLGQSRLLSVAVLLIITLNFYVQGMRKPIQIFQNAAGIYFENRHVPLIEAAVNLLASLILVHFFGLGGVLLGTLTSTMVLYGYSFPKYIYVPVFGRKNSQYVWEQLLLFLTFLAILAISTLISLTYSGLSSPWLKFFLSGFTALLVPNALLFLLFRKSHSFAYFKNLLTTLIFRKK